jgi:hypothetical protein
MQGAHSNMVEALCSKQEGHEFNSRWGHLISFNLPNPSSRTMTLVSTQPLTGMGTRSFPGRQTAKGM